MRKGTHKWLIWCSLGVVLSLSAACFGEGSEASHSGLVFTSTVGGVKWKVCYSENVRDEITYAEIYGSSSQEYGDVSVPDVLSFDSGGSAGMRYAHPTVLRAGVFRGLQTLRTVSIPLTYKTIKVPAFWGCTNLRAINVSSGCPNDSSVDGVLFDKKRKILKKYPEGKIASSYAVPSTVTELAEGCFAYASMTTISFAGDAPLCGEDVFYGAQHSLALLYPQGAKGWTKIWNGVSTYAIPNVVSNVKAGNGTSPSSVEVTWSENAVATSYKIYRATSGTAEKILLGTVWGATRYVDTSVVSGTRYYYSIVPVNGPAEGQSSQAVEGWAQQIKVTVHFNGNGGSLDEYQVVYTEGLPYGSFPGVTCPGRTFRGWYTAPLGGTKVETSDLASAATTTLYAQWREVATGDFDCYIPMIPDTEIVILRYTGSDSRVTVPDAIAGCKVVAVDDEAFANCSNLESVTFPAGMRSIGYYAFKGCTSLTSIQLPQSVKSICTGAFCDCISLHSIELPKKLEIFGAAVFRGCESLESLTIPEGVDEVPSSLCKDCRSLESVTIPSSVKTIGDEAFHDCSCLCSIELPNGLESIEHTAFYGCFNLKELLIPSGVTYIGEYAFYDCASLTSIEIPAALTEIRPGAFGGCRALTSVNVPQGVKSIGDYAFYECDRLQTVHLPEGLTSIDSGVFSSCWNLENVVLPESLTSIGTWAFSTCCNCLKQIRIPAKVESIGQWAFTGCLSLSAVNVDSGNAYFTSIDGVLYDKSVSTLLYCPSGKTGRLTVPASVTTLDKESLTTAALLEEIDVDAGNGCFAAANGLLYDKSMTRLIRCPAGVKGEVEVAAGVNQIEYAAFACCEQITAVELPQGLSDLGTSTFAGCVTLKGVVIPEGVNAIGSAVFSGCSALSWIKIPKSVTEIGEYAFSGCESLSKVIVDKGDVSRVSNLLANAGVYLSRVSVTECGEDEDDHYKVVFIADGTTMSRVELEWCRNQVNNLVPCMAMPPSGKRFAGWACSNGRRYDDGMLVFDLAKPGEIVTMTAIWE